MDPIYCQPFNPYHPYFLQGVPSKIGSYPDTNPLSHYSSMAFILNQLAFSRKFSFQLPSYGVAESIRDCSVIWDFGCLALCACASRDPDKEAQTLRWEDPMRNWIWINQYDSRITSTRFWSYSMLEFHRNASVWTVIHHRKHLLCIC